MNGSSGIQPTVELATTNGNGFYPYPVYPMMGNGYGNNGGFLGGDGIWALLLFALLFGNGAWGNNGGFFGGNSFDNGYAWLSNGQKEIMNNTNNGFDTLHLSNQIEGVRDGRYGRDEYGRGDYGRDSYGNYGEYRERGRDSYGRRERDSRGRYRGHDHIDDMYEEYGRYMEGRSRYGANEDTRKSLEYMLRSMEDFAHMLKEDAGSEQEVQMIRESAQRIASM